WRAADSPVSSWSAPRSGLRPFPTRRSSDLYSRRGAEEKNGALSGIAEEGDSAAESRMDFRWGCAPHPGPFSPWPRVGKGKRAFRSEEHTSELQSRENLVCRLLLEKKKPHHS